MRDTIRLLVLAASTLAGGTVAAGTATSNLSVTATVNSTCQTSTTTVAFGVYNPASGSASDSTGAVKVQCTVGTTYTIALDAGGNPGTPGDVTTRRMAANVSDRLPYQLFLDSARTTVWGDGGSGSLNPVSGSHSGDGSEQSYTVYGRIAAGQFVAPGSYIDTVVATVSYV
jgi:spore coat protein U-like protein